MKKLVIAFALLFCFAASMFAGQDEGGLFQRGEMPNTETNSMNMRDGFPGLPGHGENGNQPAPLGSGLTILTALGACYLIGKKRKK